jgi:hypothetical protein
MRWWRGAALWLAAAGCGSDDSNLAPAPTVTTLLVVTSIEGFPLDPDGFDLSLDGGSSARMAVNDTAVFPGITAGDHLVNLTGISEECHVRGLNPRTVNSAAGATAQTTFSLLCGAPGPGRLIVKTFTYGARPKLYLVEIDGGPSATIGPEDEITIYSVPGGFNTVTLSLVPGTCDVIAANPRVLLVPGGGSRITLFKVRCPE